MNNGLYLTLVFTLIPTAVIVIAIAGRPLLMLPHRLFPRLSEDTIYVWGVVTAAFIGTALMMYLSLSLAFSTGGMAFPPAGLLQFNLPTLYLLLFLFGVPLAVVGLIVAGKPRLTWPHRALLEYISAETACALSAAVLVVGGALAEVWLAAQLMAG